MITPAAITTVRFNNSLPLLFFGSTFICEPLYATYRGIFYNTLLGRFNNIVGFSPRYPPRVAVDGRVKNATIAVLKHPKKDANAPNDKNQ
jgi:hypothetical protein